MILRKLFHVEPSALNDPEIIKSLKRITCITAVFLFSMGMFFVPPLKQDFAVFWSVSQFIINGTPQNAYNHPLLSEAFRNTLHQSDHFIMYWLYPPYALLINAPLALVNYKLSWLLFVIITAFWLTRAVTAIAPMPITLWAVLASPALMCTTLGAQNGALNASLAGAGLLLLGTQPLLAGVCLGILSYKPHLVPLLFLMLLIDRHWKALASAVITILLLSAVSTLLYGVGIWQSWWNAIHDTSVNISNYTFPYEKMASVFGAARGWGLPADMSLGVHIPVAVAAIILLGKIWIQRRTSFDIKVTAIILTTLISIPYMYYYDYPLSLVALAFWARHATKAGWQKEEYPVMLMIWLSPLWLLINYIAAPLPVPTFVLLYALLVLLRRLKSEAISASWIHPAF